ncbi:glycosyltransferase family A protein [Paenibacillus sp.]|uniref:glycosyltransferase family A protein n=1 Tax=Paenibacillus sp. TaxID=58172 RepID=UPI002D75A8BA|nr:glycosyltransferase family A protein [Paenibacillus sp.]HZG88201.1 glycosyltransferase family A protein [Paenibacillus sp.]
MTKKRRQKQWHKGAFKAGIDSARSFDSSEMNKLRLVDSLQQLNMRWGTWFTKQKFKNIPRDNYSAACHQFLHGYRSTAEVNVSAELLPPTPKKVGCIISAVDEHETLQKQLDELRRLTLEEVIVVLNGSSAELLRIVREHPIGATIVYYQEPLGYDVGRAVGARASSSDILLFLDSDMIVDADQLLPFIYEVEKGADVVLNPITPLFPPNCSDWDSVSNMKYFLNLCLGRKDLLASSLTAVPHALSRRAVETIGPDVLAVPPLAQARALRAGLTVTNAPVIVDVIKKNLIREHNVGANNSVEQLIVGDHLEAIHDSFLELGDRLLFPDRIRRRDLLREGDEEIGF